MDSPYLVTDLVFSNPKRRGESQQGWMVRIGNMIQKAARNEGLLFARDKASEHRDKYPVKSQSHCGFESLIEEIEGEMGL
ncbi:MAG: hypothetical protein KGJ13_07945 [Patescibacteria group bacterium]|nr:hypothetical protein [Patescibacteria group bacterium]